MELPFAVSEEESSNNNNHHNSNNNMISFCESNDERNNNQHHQQPQHQQQQSQQQLNQPLINENNNSSNTNSLLHSVALYDNVHTEHFNNNNNGIMMSSSSNSSQYSNIISTNHTQTQQLQGLKDLSESTFVTVAESDVQDEYDDNNYNIIYNNNNNIDDVMNTIPTIKNDNYNHEYSNIVQLPPNQYGKSYHTLSSNHNTNHHDMNDVQEYVSIGIQSYQLKQKQRHSPRHKHHHNQQQQEHLTLQQESTRKRKDTTVDILSLLISSCCDPPQTSSDNNEESESKSNNTNEITAPNTNFVQLCEEASDAAKKASKLTHNGDITNAIVQHLQSAKQYKEAAAYLQRNHGVNGNNEFALMAYSLLILSNSQARIGDALMKSSGGENVGIMSTKSTGEQNNTTNNDTNKASDENRLRAKIRASMNTAEADMTESTFLSKGATNNNSDPSTSIMSVKSNAVPIHEKGHEDIIDSGNNNQVNPIDDMMELEKELRDMDMTLEMGVGLGASAHNINHNGGGSFLVVPSGSSYMASSMMWSSTIGGRTQQPSSSSSHSMQHQHQPLQNANSRSRANRVQTILDASASAHHHTTIIAPAPKTQQPTNLESSWWGQGSFLSSSTTSLSNSMVGIRSPNSMPQHQMNGMAAPANTKQLMKLLDSLKTLGDENASLLREVEDAQKVRLEAKAAREAMKQFKDEYSKRFATLKAALDKFRQEYPDTTSSENSKGTGNQNIVTKSDFVKTHTMMEMQKRDQLIKKLTTELNKTKTELLKEKADSKKKDDALRKYENFYKEVKARSAQKAKQREEEQRRQNQMKK